MTAPRRALSLEPVPSSSVGVVEELAAGLRRAATALETEAGGLNRQSSALASVWSSRPSSGRAAGRLDAVADLCESWRDRAGRAASALAVFATALGHAKSTAAVANVRISEWNRRQPLAGTRFEVNPPSELRAAVIAARLAADRLRAAESFTARQLNECTSGEGGGATSVEARIRLVDGVAAATSTQVVEAIRAALNAVPPDLILIEESIRRLDRMTTDPASAAELIASLGPEFERLRALLPDPIVGFDNGEVLRRLAVLSALATSASVRPTPRSTPSPVPTPKTPGLGDMRRVPNDQPVVTESAVDRVLDFAEDTVVHPEHLAGFGSLGSDGGRLVAASWEKAGVVMPLTAIEQFATGRHVSVTHLQLGDLVFWAGDPTQAATITRVGIYTGDGTVLFTDAGGQKVESHQLDLHDLSLVRWAMRPADLFTSQNALD
jgi:hypothetical protein